MLATHPNQRQSGKLKSEKCKRLGNAISDPIINRLTGRSAYKPESSSDYNVLTFGFQVLVGFPSPAK